MSALVRIDGAVPAANRFDPAEAMRADRRAFRAVHGRPPAEYRRSAALAAGRIAAEVAIR